MGLYGSLEVKFATATYFSIQVRRQVIIMNQFRHQSLFILHLPYSFLLLGGVRFQQLLKVLMLFLTSVDGFNWFSSWSTSSTIVFHSLQALH
jgi:hypothetical protein